MTHVGQSIRDNIVTTVTGLSTTGARVYRSRLYPMDSQKLPGICVYTKSEQSEFATMGSNRTVSRNLRVGIEIYVSALTGYDNALDDIASQIEIALQTDRTRGGFAKDTRILGFDANYSGEGEVPVATGVIEVEVLYHTKEATPEVAV